jgi:hypothetical protein
MEMELVTASASTSARESTREPLLEEEWCTLEWVPTARAMLRSGIVRIVAVIVSLS